MARPKPSKRPDVVIARPPKDKPTPTPTAATPTNTANDAKMLALRMECQAFAKLWEQQQAQMRASAASILKRSQDLGIDCLEHITHCLDAQASTDAMEEQDEETLSAGVPQLDIAFLVKHIDDTIDRKLRALINSAVSSAVAHAMEEFVSSRMGTSGSHVDRDSAMPAIQAQPASTQVRRPATYAGAVRQPPANDPSPPATNQAGARNRRVPTRAPLTNSELECFFTKKPLNGLARAILYFRGLGRRDIWQVRRLFTTLEIPAQAVQFISFIGANVAELIVLDAHKDDVVKRLAAVNVTLDPSFDPLSPRAFTDVATIERLGLTGKSEAEQAVAAKAAFVSRMDSMQKTIADHRHGLKSFLKSLRKAVAEGAPTGHFFNPALRPVPTLSFDITKTRAVIEAMRAPARQASPPSESPVLGTDSVMANPSKSSRKRPSSQVEGETELVQQSSPVGLPSGQISGLCL